MFEISRDALHHAYLLLGDQTNIRQELLPVLESLGVPLLNNPDLHFFDVEVFGISEARLLRDRAQGRSFGERKVFIISPTRFTTEAQNALLKTLEDPTANTHFFVIVREESLIIPTLRSRMQIMKVGEKEEASSEAQIFLDSSLKKRLDFAKEFRDEEKSISLFLDDLLKTIGEDISNQQALQKIYKIRLYADDRASSSRLILEHLALVL